MRVAALLVGVAAGLFLASGCGDSGSSGAGGAGGGGSTCPSCEAPTALAAPENGDVKEVSGLVASVTHPGLFYAHNDAGDSARFFALDEQGKDHGTFQLQGRTVIDLEDASSGPCSDGTDGCLYLADIGDNLETRTSYAIYRVAEPEPTTAGVRSVESEAFPFVYPDGPHDSEAMFVDPASGAVVLVTKGKKHARVFAYRPPLSADQTVTLEELGEVRVPSAEATLTGASMRRDGGGILLRSPTAVWFYPVSGNDFVSALSQTPCALPTPSEPQAEAIAWLLDGSGFRTLGEGKNERLNAVTCE